MNPEWGNESELGFMKFTDNGPVVNISTSKHLTLLSQTFVFFSFLSFKPLLGRAGKRWPKSPAGGLKMGGGRQSHFFLKGWRFWFGWFGWITARLSNSTWQWNYVSNVSIENNIQNWSYLLTNNQYLCFVIRACIEFRRPHICNLNFV